MGPFLLSCSVLPTHPSSSCSSVVNNFLIERHQSVEDRKLAQEKALLAGQPAKKHFSLRKVRRVYFFQPLLSLCLCVSVCVCLCVCVCVCSLSLCVVRIDIRSNSSLQWKLGTLWNRPSYPPLALGRRIMEHWAMELLIMCIVIANVGVLCALCVALLVSSCSCFCSCCFCCSSSCSCSCSILLLLILLFLVLLCSTVATPNQHQQTISSVSPTSSSL